MIPEDIKTAFNKFKNNHARAWAQDTEDSFTDKDRKSTKTAWMNAAESESAFLELLEAHLK